MKINGSFIKRRIVDEIVLIPTGKTALEFEGMITVNELGELIWDLLEKNSSPDEIIQKIMCEYDIDLETAQSDVNSFLEKMVSGGLLIED